MVGSSLSKIVNEAFEPDELLEEQLDTKINRDSFAIVLHNDDFNTFDFVIESLIEVCEHTLEQAEQCTFLVHFKGKCEVKIGTKDKLYPMHKELLNRGLTSELIQKN